MEYGSLAKPNQLRKLGIYGDLYTYEYLKYHRGGLNSLRLGFGFGNTIPNLDDVFIKCYHNLRTLYLERPLQKLPDHYNFPAYLRKLC